jgi:cysteine desulfurase
MKKLFDTFFEKKQTPSKRVYLDHAGATEVGVRAKRALMESLAVFGNPSGIHREGKDAGVLLDEARKEIGEVLNSHAYELYFTSSGTEACVLAILGTYYGYLRSDECKKRLQENKEALPHLIVSSIEHPAIMECVRALEREKKVSVTYLPVYEEGIVKTSDVIEALKDDTILLAVMMANNEIGTLQPIKEIGRALEENKRNKGLAHTSYPYFVSDACQAGNYCDLDVVRLRTHMLIVNSSKVYGVKGVAVLYKREGVRVDAVLLGGGQERGLRSGTENVAGAKSFAVALKEAESLRDKESKRLRTLRDSTVTLLKEAIPSLVVYGAFDIYRPIKNTVTGEVTHVLYEEKRLPNNINCRVPGISSEEMILRLDAKGFAVSHKSACASMETDGSYVLQALGTTEDEAKENIRITMGRSTTEEDMKRLVEAMREIAEKYKR